MAISTSQIRICLRLSIAIAILGILFKVMHWPYGWAVHITGILGIAIFYTLRVVQKPPRTFLDYSRLALLIFFLLHYAFRVYHLPYGFIFLYIRDVLFIRKDFEEDEHGKNVISSRKTAIAYLLYSIAAFGIVTGVLFKILHWEFGLVNGGVLLTTGLLAATISVFIDLRKS